MCGNKKLNKYKLISAYRYHQKVGGKGVAKGYYIMMGRLEDEISIVGHQANVRQVIDKAYMGVNGGVGPQLS